MQAIPTTTEVFHFPMAVLLPPLLMCLALAFMGAICVFKKKWRPVGYVLLGLATIFGGIVVPSLANDSVIISPQEFIVRSGFWFSPAHKGFVYKDVRLVRLRKQNNRPAWQIDYKDVHSETIECTTLWIQNYQVIMDALQKRGISFRNDIIGY